MNRIITIVVAIFIIQLLVVKKTFGSEGEGTTGGGICLPAE